MKWGERLLLVVLVTICILPFTANIAIAQRTRQQIAQSIFPSVVLLVMEDENGQPVSLGSGFFVRVGVIATNQHVIEEAASGYAKVVGQDTKHDIGGVVGLDVMRDLVLLSVGDIKAPSLSLGDSDKVFVGDEVYVVGNPYGLEGTFSQGIISGVRKIGQDSLLQITAPISPGSSGGPVLNAQGQVIGVAVAMFKGGQNLNFAVPASYLSSLLSDMKPVAPLLGKTQLRQEKSILDDFGGRSIEGVIGTLYTWDYSPLSLYSFSLRNKLRQPVKDVYCLVVFYTDIGEPIDVDVVEYREEIIPAGLAKRVTNQHVDGSVKQLVGTSQRSVEIRVLDFKIVE